MSPSVCKYGKNVGVGLGEVPPFPSFYIQTVPDHPLGRVGLCLGTLEHNLEVRCGEWEWMLCCKAPMGHFARLHCNMPPESCLCPGGGNDCAWGGMGWRTPQVQVPKGPRRSSSDTGFKEHLPFTLALGNWRMLSGAFSFQMELFLSGQTRTVL